MPGIVAVVGSQIDESLINSMACSINHEKWQQTDLYFEPPLAIGRVHLGIINAEPQPIFNEDKSICIVMDGEVFDYDEEKKRLELSGHKFEVGNDPEFCLHLFEENGEKFVEKLNGSFVLVIYDIRNKKIIIVNDRHGLRPFYYTKNGNRYIFSSEVKAILRDNRFKKDIDHEAVADFFAFEKILGNKTLFKRIKMMLPASIITWSKGKISNKKYWDIMFKERHNQNLTEEYYVNALVTLFRKAVERRLKGRHRFGVFLSGGLDSRSIVGAIGNEFNPITTFTYGIRGDESKIAKQVSEKLRMKNEFIELRSDYLVSFAEKGVYLTDGMLNCANLWWISLLRKLKKNVDVMFHGTCLDVLLGTYLSRVMFRHFVHEGSHIFMERKIGEMKSNTFASLVYQKFNNLVTEEMMPHFFSNAYYQKIKKYPRKSFEKSLSKVKGKDSVNKVDSLYLQSIARYNLSTVVLRNFLEDRTPGFDNDFFEFAVGVPPKLRFGYGLYNKFLVKLASELARIPYQRTGVAPIAPILAQRIGLLVKGGYKFFLWKLKEKTRGIISLPQKMGYPDLGEWIRKDRNLRTFFESILLDKKTLERGYFNSSFIIQMVKNHMNGKKDWTMQLCALLTFELWHRLFIDKSSEEKVCAHE